MRSARDSAFQASTDRFHSTQPLSRRALHSAYPYHIVFIHIYIHSCSPPALPFLSQGLSWLRARLKAFALAPTGGRYVGSSMKTGRYSGASGRMDRDSECSIFV